MQSTLVDCNSSAMHPEHDQQHPQPSPVRSATAATRPVLLVLTGPSGVGKDLLLSHLGASEAQRHFTITATTRAKRIGERDGVHYHFVGKRHFEAMIKRSELLEWAVVYGNYYGVPKAQVEEALAAGKDVIIKADVQGAQTIKRLAPDAVVVFLAPPSLDELRRRLTGRKSESDDALALRLKQAAQEMSIASDFDHIVIHHTDATPAAAAEVERIIAAHRIKS